MEDYTLEEIYIIAGREDKTVLIQFKSGSDSYIKYGKSILGVFVYTQKEREEMDVLVKNGPFNKNGLARVKYLEYNLPSNKVADLLSNGVPSSDISEIVYSKFAATNSFHSNSKRMVKKLEIKTTGEPKGGDLDWMYGFNKKLISDGVILSPRERSFYLAGKLYYEPESLDESDNEEIYKEDIIDPTVEYEYLVIKFMKEEIGDEENSRLNQLIKQRANSIFEKLNGYLIEAGSSYKKLVKNNMGKAIELATKAMFFTERRLNIGGKLPVYVDLDSYFHVFMRHVEEFKINKQFEHKDNFQWSIDDVFFVMEKVVHEIDDEYQAYRNSNINDRFSKYGPQSVYFEGDYYTLHIEKDGRISTFHKNRK
ncbi:MAG: hypothetical protein ACERKD_12060 [Prolixibacteraceae bacterium]